jgi:hypothetical protein
VGWPARLIGKAIPRIGRVPGGVEAVGGRHTERQDRGCSQPGCGSRAPMRILNLQWTAPGILEALIPGRMQSHGCTAEVPR